MHGLQLNCLFRQRTLFVALMMALPLISSAEEVLPAAEVETLTEVSVTSKQMRAKHQRKLNLTQLSLLVRLQGWILR